MHKQKSGTRVYCAVLLLLAAFTIFFVSAMGFLNYRSSAIELEEQVIGRVEAELVTEIETAIGFGKSFSNYYGIEENFNAFQEQYPGVEPFVISYEGELLYCIRDEGGKVNEELIKLLNSREFAKALPDLEGEHYTVIRSGKRKAMFTSIHQEGETVGYYGAFYSNDVFAESFTKLLKNIVILGIISMALVFIAILIFVRIVKNEKWQKTHRRKSDQTIERLLSVAILSLDILLLSGLSIYIYQVDYRDRIGTSVESAMRMLETKIEHVRAQGVDLREVDNLSKFISDRISSMEVLRSIRITERITEVKRTNEASNIISFVFGSGGDGGGRLYLEGEISESAVNKEMNTLILVLLSTMIILMIFVFELNRLMELLTNWGDKKRKEAEDFSEKKVSIVLRFTGFLCSTAEYMCVPYAAMMIRESGESLFGLSVGMTAALPLTVEGITQMVGMLLLPRLVKKYNTRVVLVVSGILMIFCNFTAFTAVGALTIVLCRAAAGFAYAGFKQVSNFLITKGYETEEGRSENISQDNAGLLAGSTCGAGLGAILSANAGYSVAFLVSAGFFVVYLLFTMFLVPWRTLSGRMSEEGETKIRVSKVLKMAFSAEMLFFILVIAIPLNIGVMLCVTLIPAICQTNNISSIMLSYCYIANGLAGIYLGPALVSAAKKRFGLQPCIALAFALTAGGIFILHIPPVVVMIVLSSMILGFLDGFGTPMVTDRFMSLRVVRNAVDESTALIFSVVLSYILLTFAPMVAELLLLPGEGAFSPMMIGAVVYAAAAVLLLLVRRK